MRFKENFARGIAFMELIKKIARVVEIGEQASGYMTIHVIKKNTETRVSRLKYDLLSDINW